MNAPQIIMIVLFALSLGISIEQHGKPKTGRNCAWTSLVGITINLAILIWGGFFK